MQLARFPHINLGHFPTPLEPMRNLSMRLGGPNLYIKRDDCTGLATGGNKTRKLEFLIADALKQGADTLITQGATQSNHVRQTAAAAAKVGLDCMILLEQRVLDFGEEYEESGNVMLDTLLGGKIVERLPAGMDMQKAMDDLAAQLRTRGKRPYVIPGGGSNPIGALGYVACAMELLQQSHEAGLRIDHVVHATGSTGTQAGLVAGFEGTNSRVQVLGISVRSPKQQQEDNVHRLAQATARHLGFEGVSRESIVVNSDYVGGGYGIPTSEMVEAVELTARHEGILLDPVYTGKAMAGLLGLIGAGRFAKEENVIFLHTGGSAALFGYRRVFTSR